MPRFQGLSPKQKKSTTAFLHSFLSKIFFLPLGRYHTEFFFLIGNCYSPILMKAFPGPRQVPSHWLALLCNETSKGLTQVFNSFPQILFQTLLTWLCPYDSLSLSTVNSNWLNPMASFFPLICYVLDIVKYLENYLNIYLLLIFCKAFMRK